jgi:hypothetical protein
MRYLVTVACLFLSTASLSAQRTVDPGLYVGTRVRVKSVQVEQAGVPRADNLSGRFVAYRAESLYVEPQPGVAPRPVALSNVRSLWVSQGRMRRSTLRGVMFGGLAGGALVAAITAASGDGCTELPTGYVDCMTAKPDVVLGFGIGAAIGGVIGGTIGYFRRSEWWERIR